jgi:hypothetical protein
MSYRKNVSGQFVYFALIDASDGSALTGATVTAQRSIDGGSQGACTGTVNDKGDGQYELAASQADMNGNDIGFLFTATGAIPVSISVVTTAGDPTDSVRGGLTALPNAAAAATGGLATVDSANSVKGQFRVKKNVALAGFTFIMRDTAGDPATGLTVTATRSIDGAAPDPCANAVGEVTTGGGRYKIDLAAADLNGNVVSVLFTASGAKAKDYTFLPEP